MASHLRVESSPEPAANGDPATISFVIPVYRNRGTLRATYEQVVEMLRQALPDLGYQFVFIDDGSDDGSLDEILDLRASDPRVTCLNFSRNFGQVPAIVAGLREAGGDAVVILSADLQDPVALIEEMIRQWKAGAQVVVCYRIAREDSFAARITSRIFYRLIRYSVPNMPAGGFDFVLLDRQPARVMAELRDRNRFFQGDVLWLGFRTHFIPYERRKREVGRSQWTFWKKLKYFIDGLISTSYLPIRFMSLVGTLTALAGFAYALLVVYLRLIHETPFQGYAPIMIVLLIVGGLIMTMLGVIGEYVWRIYDETRGRPPYIVRRRFDSSVDDESAEPASAATRH
ncbi:MAG: glycosyltransferase family 2 protein [Isosphaeraceae bacterium]